MGPHSPFSNIPVQWHCLKALPLVSADRGILQHGYSDIKVHVDQSFKDYSKNALSVNLLTCLGSPCWIKSNLYKNLITS